VIVQPTRKRPRFLHAGRLVVQMTVVLLLAWADSAPAEVFRLGTWDGALEGSVDISHQDVETSGSPTVTSDYMRTEERFSLRNSGAYVYHPRVLMLSVGGTFGLVQQQFKTEGRSSSGNGTLTQYDVLVDLLQEHPVSMNLFANRNESTLPQVFAGESKLTNEARGATLFARRLYIPSTFAFRQERQVEEARTGDLRSRRENEENILRYQGLRGWTNKEMDAEYEFVDNIDKVIPGVNYRSHDGRLNFDLDFGPELNRHWDSRLRYYERMGSGALGNLTTASADEMLRVNHTDRFWSLYRYALTHTEAPGGAATTHTAEGSVHHEIRRNFFTNAGLEGAVQTLPGGEKNVYRSRLDFLYTRRLPGKGRISIGQGGGYQYEDNRFRAGCPAHCPQQPFRGRVFRSDYEGPGWSVASRLRASSGAPDRDRTWPRLHVEDHRRHHRGCAGSVCGHHAGYQSRGRDRGGLRLHRSDFPGAHHGYLALQSQCRLRLDTHLLRSPAAGSNVALRS